MSVTASGSDFTSEVIALCVDTLVIALAQCGLTAESCADAMVVARNTAADPPEDDHKPQ